MTLIGLMLTMFLVHEMVMTQFVTHFTLFHLAILNYDYQVVWRAAEVLADQFSVVGNQCDFIFSLIKFIPMESDVLRVHREYQRE
jgi:hypothetical protein